MRVFVIGVVLACASSLIAQTNVVDPPVQKPTVMPQAPSQKARLKRGAMPGTAPGNAKAPNVPPTTPVVTLQGVCKDRQAKSACETVITREDLDRYAIAFAPDVAETARGRLAVQYARSLAFSSLAEQQGLDKNPMLAKEIDAQLKLVRMRLLGSAFQQTLQKQPAAIAETEIQTYYEKHRDQYEQAEVRRVAVPFLVPTESGRPLDHSAVKSEMEELRSRAAAGEDLNQLLLDAFKHLHIQATPPPVNVLTLRRSSVQGDEAKAFELNPGEVSAVLDSVAAFAVFKLESKGPMPIASVRQEIEATLLRERMQSEITKATKKISAQFNLQYLQMSSQPDLFGPGAAISGPAPIRGSMRKAPITRP